MKQYTAFELAAYLQGFGVPAGVVQSPEQMQADPQLALRGHYARLLHPEMGERTYDSAAFRLSKTPGRPRKPAPCLGEDNAYVYRDVLGLDDDEFIELLADGAFE
jgi:crotonobetainyl-CoA:carnitine CoA-transferase CaiB-like acyl-CoA transferase